MWRVVGRGLCWSGCGMEGLGSGVGERVGFGVVLGGVVWARGMGLGE